MKTPRKKTDAILFTLEGTNAGRRAKITISAASNDELRATLAQIDDLIGRETHAPHAQNAAPSPELKCPKCAADVFDNRATRQRGSKVPVIKCKKCAWRLWEEPRDDSERSENQLWIAKYGNPY